MTSDLDLIRKEARVVFGGLTVFHRRAALKRLLALLDGVAGLAREGDVVLSSEQAEAFLPKAHPGSGVVWPPRDYIAALAFIASGRPGEEQA